MTGSKTRMRRSPEAAAYDECQAGGLSQGEVCGMPGLFALGFR